MAVTPAVRSHEVADEFAAFLSSPSTADPFPLFRRVREVAPVHRSPLGFWAVLGYPEAEQLARSNRVRREPAAAAQWRRLDRPDDPPDIATAIDIWLSKIVFRDPPAHDRLRRLISRAFTPRAIGRWRAMIDHVVQGLVADLGAVDDGAEVDFMTAVAFPLPERVICEVLGVPHTDHAMWNGWFRQVIEPGALWHATGDVPGRDDVARQAKSALAALTGYFRNLVRERRDDRFGDDLLSLLLRAETDGDQLDEDELVATLIMLVGAGHTTTAHLLGNGLVALLSQPDAISTLRARPDLVPDAIDEMLRYRGPSRGQPYLAVEPMTLGSVTIEPGEYIQPYFNATNRDARRFGNAERFDVTRRQDGHLAFGAGIHYCVGAALAKLEAEVAFGHLLGSVEFELALDDVSQVEWLYASVHGPRRLPVLPNRVAQRDRV